MAEKLAMALDDIIKKTSGRRGRGTGRGRRSPRAGGRRGASTRGRPIPTLITRSRGIPNGKWQNVRFGSGGGFGRGRMSGGRVNATSKLLVSNLDYSVSDSDIKELFGELGPLRRASIHFDKSGRSLATADVVFERRVDAVRAQKQYNNIPLDGRPMRIELVGAQGGRLMSQRVGSAPSLRAEAGGKRSFGGGRSRGSGGRRGRGGRGSGRGAGRSKEPAPTQEDLDKELDAYIHKME